jgi:hypothetical protein
LKKNPYEIETFISIADFPRVITKQYALDALAIINNKLNALKIETLRTKGHYLNAIKNEITKFEGFKKFIQGKLTKIHDEEFVKLVGKKPEVSKVFETPEKPKKTKDTKDAKNTEKPKKTRKKKSVVETVKEVFTESSED